MADDARERIVCDCGECASCDSMTASTTSSGSHSWGERGGRRGEAGDGKKEGRAEQRVLSGFGECGFGGGALRKDGRDREEEKK